ncbi:hypothetical protein ENUP19_0251G0002 [Entamoeba nuttalli]|uniref:Uncharacterized protein n=1 Tax=Entamoeba nuttalli TaxID=412467 RepID=A0ABQ0DR88_9EUKA
MLFGILPDNITTISTLDTTIGVINATTTKIYERIGYTNDSIGLTHKQRVRK